LYIFSIIMDGAVAIPMVHDADIPDADSKTPVIAPDVFQPIFGSPQSFLPARQSSGVGGLLARLASSAPVSPLPAKPNGEDCLSSPLPPRTADPSDNLWTTAQVSAEMKSQDVRDELSTVAALPPAARPASAPTGSIFSTSRVNLPAVLRIPTASVDLAIGAASVAVLPGVASGAAQIAAPLAAVDIVSGVAQVAVVAIPVSSDRQEKTEQKASTVSTAPVSVTPAALAAVHKATLAAHHEREKAAKRKASPSAAVVKAVAAKAVAAKAAAVYVDDDDDAALPTSSGAAAAGATAAGAAGTAPSFGLSVNTRPISAALVAKIKEQNGTKPKDVFLGCLRAAMSPELLSLWEAARAEGKGLPYVHPDPEDPSSICLSLFRSDKVMVAPEPWGFTEPLKKKSRKAKSAAAAASR
jgi:hypothetical protein